VIPNFSLPEINVPATSSGVTMASCGVWDMNFRETLKALDGFRDDGVVPKKPGRDLFTVADMDNLAVLDIIRVGEWSSARRIFLVILIFTDIDALQCH
jgi:hypothetical protein